jgi:hypothetical protein
VVELAEAILLDNSGEGAIALGADEVVDGDGHGIGRR